MTTRVGEGGAALRVVATKLPYLAPALRQVGEYVLEDPGRAQHLTITELAAACGVAESTVSRFVREVGLARYQDLRIGAAETAVLNRQSSAGSPEPSVYAGVAPDDSLGEIATKISASSEQALRQTASLLNLDALDRAVSLIEASDVVMFACMGSSSLAAEDGVMRLTRAGKKCMLFRDQSIQVMSATILGPDDLVIGISDSGESLPVIDALRLARRHGASTIAITAGDGSSVIDQADVTLFTARGTSVGELYGETVTSKWGQVLVMDMLYAAFAARTYDRTMAHLKETYSAGIRHSRAR
ncbi:MAG: MurR/RpiR family transcriptional regulator [Candidatus Nanopelagicales bacterium]